MPLSLKESLACRPDRENTAGCPFQLRHKRARSEVTVQWSVRGREKRRTRTLNECAFTQSFYCDRGSLGCGALAPLDKGLLVGLTCYSRNRRVSMGSDVGERTWVRP